MVILDKISKHWRLVSVPTGAGGAEARHSRLLANKHRQQMSVLQMIYKTHPQLVRGEPNVQVSDDVVRQWEADILATKNGSAVDIRNKINFLALAGC
jgi:hypothetical protein